MGPKRNRHEKAAFRKVKAATRKQKQTNGDGEQNENDIEFDDDVPKMKIQLEKLGLVLKEVEGDGNCLFRALSDQLFGHPEKHKQLRKEVVTYMRNHKEDFEPFHSDENVPFDHHLDLLERDGTYAGNDGLVAFARANNITIAIHQLNEPLWQIHGSTNGETKCDNELHISYHNGDHYNSIRKRGQVNTGAPPNIRINIKNDGCASEETSQPPASDNIWSEEGTGSRIFGPEVSQVAVKGQKKLSAKARKKHQKMQRQQNNGDSDDDLPAVEALSL